MSVVRTVAAVLFGLLVGSVVNMGLITIGSVIVPAPPGVDSSDVESIAASIHLYETRHFIPPLLAHALGTFIGAITATLIDDRRGKMVALIIGALFFAGGVAASFIIPAPAGYIAIDLVAAYFPMAMAAYWIVKQAKRRADESRQAG